mmetsp:Transcript_29680/g.63927  ORF Transcript_29680/g.63927 Transcript_29680/m.63927 type:complete len:256 (+) Transcript_29680:369-1136(+)
MHFLLGSVGGSGSSSSSSGSGNDGSRCIPVTEQTTLLARTLGSDCLALGHGSIVYEGRDELFHIVVEGGVKDLYHLMGRVVCDGLELDCSRRMRLYGGGTKTTGSSLGVRGGTCSGDVTFDNIGLYGRRSSSLLATAASVTADNGSGTTLLVLLARILLLLRPLLLQYPLLHILRDLPDRTQSFLVQVVTLHILLVLDQFHRSHHLAVLARLVIDLGPSCGDHPGQFEESDLAVTLTMFALGGLLGFPTDVPVGA